MEFVEEIGTCRGFKKVVSAVVTPLEDMESSDPVLRGTLKALKAECVQYGEHQRSLLASRTATIVEAAISIEVFVALHDVTFGLKLQHRNYLLSVTFAAAGIRDPHLQ